jgi:hypothetical protein
VVQDFVKSFSVQSREEAVSCSPSEVGVGGTTQNQDTAPTPTTWQFQEGTGGNDDPGEDDISYRDRLFQEARAQEVRKELREARKYILKLEEEKRSEGQKSKSEQISVMEKFEEEWKNVRSTTDPTLF